MSMVGRSIFWKVLVYSSRRALLLSCKVYTLVRKASERLFLKLNTVQSLDPETVVDSFV